MMYFSKKQAGRLGKGVICDMKASRDLYLLFIRHLKKQLREPVWFFLGMLQPVLYLLLYMPLLKNLGNTEALPLNEIAQIFVPGMLIIMGISTLFAGFGFIPEIREGFLTRLLVTPAGRISIMLSYILERVFVLILQIIIILFIAFMLGLRVSVMGVMLAFLLVILIGITMVSFSYIISIATKNEDALASLVNTIFLPIMLLAGIMLPISLAPDWLKFAAHFNPFYYTVEAARSMFLGNFADPTILLAFLIMGFLSVILVLIAVRSLRSMSA